MSSLRARYLMKYDANLICMLAIASIVFVRALSFARRFAYSGKIKLVSRSPLLVLPLLELRSAIEINMDIF